MASKKQILCRSSIAFVLLVLLVGFIGPTFQKPGQSHGHFPRGTLEDQMQTTAYCLADYVDGIYPWSAKGSDAALEMFFGWLNDTEPRMSQRCRPDASEKIRFWYLNNPNAGDMPVDTILLVEKVLGESGLGVLVCTVEGRFYRLESCTGSSARLLGRRYANIERD